MAEWEAQFVQAVWMEKRFFESMSRCFWGKKE